MNGMARLLAVTQHDDDLLYLTPSDMGSLIEIEDIICLARCSLDMHPGKSNWVEDAGGLPNYICEIARALVRDGHPVSRAIAIAVGRCKRWAAGVGDVKADTRAKAAAAIAQWEAKKARAHATK